MCKVGRSGNVLKVGGFGESFVLRVKESKVLRYNIEESNESRENGEGDCMSTDCH